MARVGPAILVAAPPPRAPARTPRAVGILMSLALGLALAIAVVSLVVAPPHVDRRSFEILAVLLLLVAAADASRQGVYGDAFTSWGSTPVIAAGVLICPAAVAMIEVTVTLVGDAFRRRLRPATAYNMAVYTIAGSAATGVMLGSMRLTTQPTLLVAIGALAGLTYYTIDAVLVCLAVAIWEQRRFTDVFREQAAWLAPHYTMYGLLAAGLVLGERTLGLLGLALFVMPAIAMLAATGQYLRRTETMVNRVRAANETLEGLLADNRGLLAALGRQHVAMIRGMASAIDAKDPYTAGHTERVARYAVAIAQALGLDESMQCEIEQGALLHDIGKIGVPDAVLSKPGPLDKSEWEQMREHPLVACRILHDLDLPPVVVTIVRHHHENLDGTGYPDQLREDEVSVAARIARVADAFDAMTSTRPYRDGMTVAEALAELHRCVGTQFARDVVEALERQIERGALRRSIEPQTGTRLELAG